jgi:hypothetical protein
MLSMAVACGFSASQAPRRLQDQVRALRQGEGARVGGFQLLVLQHVALPELATDKPEPSSPAASAAPTGPPPTMAIST